MEWSEHFAAQPETLRYCNFVADKLDLRRDIEFRSRIEAAAWDQAAGEWEIESDAGGRARARFLITAIGPLSAPTMPTIPGVQSFRGEAYHTGLWPHEPVSVVGKRVAVIGTGATAVQAITEIAKTRAPDGLQRTPNWCAPLHNSPRTPPRRRGSRPRTRRSSRAAASRTGASSTTPTRGTPST